ncbi:bifunctional glutamate/proline--tRNA ligase isoform X2 [Phymastichus coffea]|uniref:bifunctional glutamate/proline--tRNA ligase isoform X2 n=1 Tax=Phymastichus coffea TaxID=108790 RepID=UPI00273C1CC4|nr:bifunctional glutamate/proline--tRNA ligase isoform X2 [Phymastichus coffea]
MPFKLVVNAADPPVGALIIAEILRPKLNSDLEVVWSNNFSRYNPVSLQFLVNDEDVWADTTSDVARYLSRLEKTKLYGSEDPFEKTEVDHWLTFSEKTFNTPDKVTNALYYLDHRLMPRTWLVAKHLTIADICVFSKLNSLVDISSVKSKYPNLFRWYKQMLGLPEVEKVLSVISKNEINKFNKSKEIGKRKQEGKFIELPGAEMGKVIVRFPPEASGYLHIGHAKAALLNQYYAENFKGQLIMRFDDTNPAKENVEFEKAILEDLEMLQIKPDRFTHSSDYFDLMLQYCEKLLKDGKAYADNTPAPQMKEQRDKKLPSSNRSNSLEENLYFWKEMQLGTPIGQTYCIRAKIDYQSANGCMRDPTIYRCKLEHHPRTGTKYKVYPTYDFACPIVDALENVTHTLRTTEYHDRDEQFYWFIEQLNLNRPYIWEYSRLNMTNTVLSKRKLAWFVDEGLVDGWDDPRFPTVRGILRRGMTVEGLKQFIIAQGSSRSVVFMEWDKIWAFNKKVIDPVAIRYTALTVGDTVPVEVRGAIEGFLTVANHPKDPSIGTKQVRVSSRVLIEQEDAQSLIEGQNATFINWGNIMIEKMYRQCGKIIKIDASLNLNDTNFKYTQKLTWLADSSTEIANKTPKIIKIPCFAVYFGHIIIKPVLGKDEDFKNFVANDTRREIEMLGEAELCKVKKGDIIQLQRKGFFRCDVPYAEATVHSFREQPLILFHIPDGHSTITLPGAPDKPTLYNTRPEKHSPESILKIIEDIIVQQNKVKALQDAKADKTVIDEEYCILTLLREKYRAMTGEFWLLRSIPPPVSSPRNELDDQVCPTKVNDAIIAQGNKIRNLKADKADKATIDCEVKDLLSLKEKYKSITGQDWKPGVVPPAKSTASMELQRIRETADKINEEIIAQGYIVRELKIFGADEASIDEEEKILLNLKEKYKTIANKDWKQGLISPDPSTSEEKINDEILAQMTKLTKLDESVMDTAAVDAERKTLLRLRAKFRSFTGTEWPRMTMTVSRSISTVSVELEKQNRAIKYLLTKKTSLELIAQEVAKLVTLKNEFKQLTGNDWKPVGLSSKKSIENNANFNIQKLSKPQDNKYECKDLVSKEVFHFDDNLTLPDAKPKVPKQESAIALKQQSAKAPKKAAKKSETSKVAAVQDENTKTGTRLGLEAKKNENLSDWYSQVITKGEMIEYYDVSGCYILRPWSYGIWDIIKDFFDKEIKKLGVRNCYFPIFVSKSALEREKDHITDFAPEVAWVTKSGESDLAEHIAIRPTSETVMYPAYAKWLKSYRDLPLKLNQWNNVVRWEFKHPQPFLRTREFLWQEGHTAFATKTEADEEVLIILDLYARIYEEYLAIPVVKGRKTEKEKFAGGDYTTTVEAYISASGRAIQGGTSHHLGQNFSKMFDIQVESNLEGNEKIFVYQNSWGITTRTIGVMIMIHGDDKGLVIPPKVATVQAVIVPCGITASTTTEKRDKLLDECKKLENELAAGNSIRVEGDYRDNYSPGWKFNHWELKGVPVRVELGPKDLEKGQITLVRRDTAQRITAKRSEANSSVRKLLDQIQCNLFEKATFELNEHIKQSHQWSEFCSLLDEKNLILAPFCGKIECEDKIKADSARDEATDDGSPSMGAKSLCIPFKQPDGSVENINTLKCIYKNCEEKAKFYTLFGRSY